jgi:hypothetical protein
LEKDLGVVEKSDAKEILWAIDYHGYEMQQLSTRIENRIPGGIELRTDAMGELLID